ncbi:AMP-binding protein [Halorubrum sp. DTA98]|uniref:AMP-binding protein n=1 Tax=Halorubrum sp. DTA98 TaxID=3402163 RepID=UPI003AAF6272
MDSTHAFPRTLPRIFTSALNRHPELPAIRFRSAELTYRELNRQSNAIANGFVASGIQPEDRIAVLLSNRIETPIVDIATFKAGGARLPINPALSRSEIEYVLSDSHATAVVCDDDTRPIVDAIRSTVPPEVCITTESEPPSGWRSIEQFESYHDNDCPPSVSVTPESIAGHFYTGGTTGDPKGVCYTHACLTANFLAHLLELGFEESDIGLVSTPLSHSGGTFLLSGLLAGGTVVIQRSFDIGRTIEAIDAHDVTWTFLVPTMLYRLLDEGTSRTDLESIDRIIYGAAPIQPDRLREAIDRFGPIFVQFYGQTEVPNLISTLDRRDHALAIRDGHNDLLRAAGKPCRLVDLRIVDPDTGRDVLPGDHGEIVVSSPYTFAKYFERPKVTDQTLRDGWVHTGDIGRIDDKGYLFLVDREGDVVVSGGMNVYTREVERVLGEHPAVESIAVIGVPHDDWGEAVHAVVVSAEDIGEDSLRRHVDDRLAGYKLPKSYEFVDRLPMTPLGKPDKEALRDLHWDGDRRIG